MTEDTKQSLGSQGFDSDSSEEPSGQSLPDLTRRLAHSLQKPFHCQTCSKKFASKKSLTDHMRAHTGEKHFQCDVCAKLFLRSGDLKRHLMMHSGEKPYQCEICQKQFPRKGNLQLHRITHTKSRPHPCEVCGRFFAQKSGLTQHMLVHTGIKRFQCELCLKEFARKAYLQKHMLSHRTVPLDCEVCGKTFSASRNLKLHALSHVSRKLYHCYMCEDVFSEKGAYYKHITSHNEPIECQVCFKQFADVHDLGKHSHIHTVETENGIKKKALEEHDAELEDPSEMDGEFSNGEAENIIMEISTDAKDTEVVCRTNRKHPNIHFVETEIIKDTSKNFPDAELKKVSHPDIHVVVVENISQINELCNSVVGNEIVVKEIPTDKNVEVEKVPHADGENTENLVNEMSINIHYTEFDPMFPAVASTYEVETENVKELPADVHDTMVENVPQVNGVQLESVA